MSPPAVVASECPHCSCGLSHPDQAFCTRCGLALKQPCPNCAASLATPKDDFCECGQCRTSFWGCPECGRLYHLDRTSCLNGYCPRKGVFWTSAFGGDVWDARRGHRALPSPDPGEADPPSPLPGWLVAGNRERRYASLHHSGLLISVCESGMLEMWAERGAPRGDREGGEFGEESVCLVRLDLGEPAGGPPLLHRGHLVVLGTSSLCLLEMTSNPSLSSRLELPETQGPLRAVSLGETLLVAGPEGLWEVEVETRTVRHHLPRPLSSKCDPVAGGDGTALLATGQEYLLYKAGGEVVEVARGEFTASAEWLLYADRFLLVWRNQLAYLQDGSLRLTELPGAVVARPTYDAEHDRLTVLLSDGTIRTCSPTGERFSFLCEMPGVPTTPALRLGDKVYYGSDGRYLCRDEEAILPRLNSAPWGELSYANGRMFGITKEGGLFAFCL